MNKIILIFFILLSFFINVGCSGSGSGKSDVLIPVTGVSLGKSSTSILVGATEQLAAVISPTNASNKNVTWSSSDTSVSTVDSGLVVGITTGTAIITVTTLDGGFSVTCAVTISATSVPVTGITLDGSSASVEVGGKCVLTAAIAPTSATNQNVIWSTSDSSIASLSSITGTNVTVTGAAAGEATIIATAAGDTTKIATCVVTVKAATVAVTGVSLDKTFVFVTPGTISALTATITPTGASNQTLIWTTSDNSIVSLSATTGTAITATAYSAGSAKITVSTSDSGYKATCEVTVSGDSSFSSATTDNSGNIYTAGYISGSGSYSFGNFSVKGISYAGNAVIVKYASNNSVSWAESASPGSSSPCFFKITTDSSSNLYAVGYIYGTGTYTFGSCSVSGTSTSCNPVIIKYASDGTVLWAKTMSADSLSDSFFSGVKTDTSGNIYAVGYIYGTGTYTFGSCSLKGTSSSVNAVIIKYASDGTVLWGKTVSAGSSDSFFKGVTTDSSGNICAVGYISGTGTYTFGSCLVEGASSSVNAVIIKYAPDGTVSWGKTVSTGSSDSFFNDATIYGDENIYAVGYLSGTGTYTFGSCSVNGASSSSNAMIVKYASDGSATWTKSVSAGSSNSSFSGVTIDSLGNIYVVGSISGIGTYTFGSSSVKGTNSTLYNDVNSVIVKYEPDGSAAWAKSVSAGSGKSFFNGVTIDGSGNVYAVGYIFGIGTYTFGNCSVNGLYSGINSAIVKYSSDGNVSWVK